MSKTKTVLITGAAGGIGRATVHLFSQNGWRVIGADRAPFGEEFPQGGLFIQADNADPLEIQRIYSETSAITDRLDALVNNAA